MSSVKRGFLTKQGRNVKSWKKRYFVLQDGSLVYYEDENSVVPKGQMSLYGAAIVYVQMPKVSRPNVIEISTPTRSLFVCAESTKELEEWAVAIQLAAVHASGGKVTLSSMRLKMEADDGSDDAPPAPAPVHAAASVPAKAVSTATAAAAATGDESDEDSEKPSPATPAAAAAATAAAAAAPDAAVGGTSNAQAAADEDAEAEDDGTGVVEEDGGVDAFAAEEAEAAAMKKEVSFTPEEARANTLLLDEVFRREEASWEEAKTRAKALKKERPEWAAADFKIRKQLKGHSKFVNVVHVKHDRVVSGGDDTSCRHWNLTAMKKKCVCEGHDDVVRAVTQTAEWLVSGSDDGTIKVWNPDKGKCKKTFLTSTGLGVDALGVTSDGSLLVSASNRTIQVWDLQRMCCVADVHDQHEGRISSMCMAGRFMFTGSEDHTIKVWDMTRVEVIQTLEGHRNWIFCLTVAPSRDQLFSGSETLKVWDISKMSKGKVKLSTTIDEPHDCPAVQGMAVSEDERYLVTCSMDGFIKIWELKLKSKSKPLASLENRTKFVFSVAVADNKILTADRASVVNMWWA